MKRAKSLASRRPAGLTGLRDEPIRGRLIAAPVGTKPNVSPSSQLADKDGPHSEAGPEASLRDAYGMQRRAAESLAVWSPFGVAAREFVPYGHPFLPPSVSWRCKSVLLDIGSRAETPAEVPSLRAPSGIQANP